MDLNDTAFQEQVIVQWRDWRRYLALNLRLLDLRTAGVSNEANDPFEIALALTPEQDIRQQLAAIPNDVQAIFERACDEQRQRERRRIEAERRDNGDMSSQPLDADEVDRAAFLALLDDADGHATEGIGVVPMTDGWYDVDAERLRDVPDESRYRLRSATAQTFKHGKRAASVGVLLLGAVAIWWTMPRPDEVTTTIAQTVYINDQVRVGWIPRTVTFIADQEYTLQAVAQDAEGAAEDTIWYNRDAWPLTLCAPNKVFEASVTKVQVTSEGDAPLRTSTMLDVAPTLPDIMLVNCADPKATHYGVLASVKPPIAVQVGQSALIADNQTITLVSLAVVGAGENVRLPQGKVQVVATVAANTTVDWSKFNATLRWPDGQDILPTEATPQEQGGIVFRYLVPTFTAPIDRVQWLVADPRSGSEVRWDSGVAAPLSRLQVMQESLRDVRVEAEQTTSGMLQLRISLTNAGDAPLLLTADDIVLMQDGRRQPLPPLAALRDALASGETRTLELTLSLPQQPLTLNVGAIAYTISSS